MSEPKVTKRTLADYRQHRANPNRHTERGLQIVEDSVHYNGAGRSGLAANDGTLLAGNGTWEAMERAGIQEVIEVETDGHQWVIVKRADLAPDDPRSKALMVSDNRSSELGYSPDNELLGALLADIAAQDEHLLRGAGFTEGELQALLDSSDALSLDDLEDKYGTPQDDDFWPVVRIKVSPDVYRHYQEIMQAADGETEAEKFSALIDMMYETLLRSAIKLS